MASSSRRPPLPDAPDDDDPADDYDLTEDIAIYDGYGSSGGSSRGDDSCYPPPRRSPQWGPPAFYQPSLDLGWSTLELLHSPHPLADLSEYVYLIFWADWHDAVFSLYHSTPRADTNLDDLYFHTPCLRSLDSHLRAELARTQPKPPRWNGPPFPDLVDWIACPTRLCRYGGCLGCCNMHDYLATKPTPLLARVYWLPGPPGGPPNVPTSVLLRRWRDERGEWEGPAFPDSYPSISARLLSSSSKRSRRRHTGSTGSDAMTDDSPTSSLPDHVSMPSPTTSEEEFDPAWDPMAPRPLRPILLTTYYDP